MAIPYGVFDLQDNSAGITVGVSHETSEFAARAIGRWWNYQGRRRYPRAKRLLVLADTGGSNAANRNAWKYFLQCQVADAHGLSVRVAHYPSGASKWNPIEHRVFAEISKNWQGRPLDTYETCLNYIRTTRTSTGLTVRAWLDKKDYEKGIKIPKEQMATLDLVEDERLPRWNYTLKPRPARARGPR
jgi:hypothetical protein